MKPWWPVDGRLVGRRQGGCGRRRVGLAAVGFVSLAAVALTITTVIAYQNIQRKVPTLATAANGSSTVNVSWLARSHCCSMPQKCHHPFALALCPLPSASFDPNSASIPSFALSPGPPSLPPSALSQAAACPGCVLISHPKLGCPDIPYSTSTVPSSWYRCCTL
jgi:hypothetical protein